MFTELAESERIPWLSTVYSTDWVPLSFGLDPTLYFSFKSSLI